MGSLRLGVNLGYWGAGNDKDNLVLAQEADRLGYSSAWAAEAYGSDAATVLSWGAAQTERIDIGSALFPIPGRPPGGAPVNPGAPGPPSRGPVPAGARGSPPPGPPGGARGGVG